MIYTHSELHRMVPILQRTTKHGYPAMSRVKLSRCLNILTLRLLFVGKSWRDKKTHADCFSARVQCLTKRISEWKIIEQYIHEWHYFKAIMFVWCYEGKNLETIVLQRNFNIFKYSNCDLLFNVSVSSHLSFSINYRKFNLFGFLLWKLIHKNVIEGCQMSYSEHYFLFVYHSKCLWSVWCQPIIWKPSQSSNGFYCLCLGCLLYYFPT